MAAHNDDLEFGDNGLDQLPPSTLHSLEHNALSSTQQQQIAARKQHRYGQITRPFKAPSRIAAPLHRSLPAAPPTVAVSVSPTSSEYGGIEDEEIFDLDGPTLDLGSHLPASKTHAAPPYIDIGTAAPVAIHDEPVALPPQYHAVPPTAHSGASPLDAHVKQLESELDAVRLSLQTAQEANQKQAGEISIIRAKQEKEAKEHEAKIAAIQKLHADETARQKADMDVARKEIQAFETNNRFLEHDLTLARDERAKRLKPSARNVPARVPPSRVPAQNAPQSLPYRDGFDDHEILLSPSKPKSKPPTPRVGEKRKRNINVSPAPRLQLNAPPPIASPAVNTAELMAAKQALAQHQDAQNLQFQMIQRLMNHRPFDSHDRVLETLSRLAFPSLPDHSVAGLISEGLSLFTDVTGDGDLFSHVCTLLSDLWARCLQDKFYAPVYLLLDLYEFVLAISPKAPHMSLIEGFIPLATKTIDLIAVPRARPSPDSKPDPSLLGCINVDQILTIMQSMALDASLSTEDCQTFWKKMEFDFTLMMLNKSQPLPHIMLVLQMLGSSALPASFGIISENTERQSVLEVHTIDRLTTLLFERPEAPPDEPSYEDTEIAALQIETIRVLNALAITKHGSEVLAQHRTAIGRLVRLLHVQVTKLYDLPPTTIELIDGSAKTAESSTIHDLTATIINLTIRLIYHLLMNYAELINLRDKLIVIPGGHHKFLVSLTRLAFSEQLVYEAGIEEEAVDAAHEILDGILSPEEGEAVVQAIETPRGTIVTRGSAPG